MTLRQITLSLLLAVTVGVAFLAAHSITVQGTVVAVEPTRVQVKTTDAKKTEQTAWYAVDRDTLVKRGPKTVKYADAKITPGERIVVIVDEHAETKNLAEEIRLAAK